MRDRMLRGELHIWDEDPDLEAEYLRGQAMLARYNATAPDAYGERDTILRELLGAVGEGVKVQTPLQCDYGVRVFLGDRVFINFGCVLLDSRPITIGDGCQIATNVQLLTATHPIDPTARAAGWELAKPITLGTNVWLGGGVIVCPGVTIGDDTAVGAGAVVTRDLPAGVLAVGNPARVVREIDSDEKSSTPPPGPSDWRA